MRPESDEGEASVAWRLRLEGVARDIDSGLAPEQRGEELTQLRETIAALLAPATTAR
jgi:MoxR-like ATPase